MTTVLTPAAKQQFFDNNGSPLVRGKLFVYEAGTSTKATTYTDSSGLSQNANPIILDYRGECDLWIDPNVRLKYVLASPTDTDPPSNPIWSVDNVVSSQLITLYGGVDTGSFNAYILNFTANFSAYTDGIVIYWIPSNTNTGASTINVNGLGPVAIVNQDLTPLIASQLIGGQVATIMYKSGGFLLLSSGIAPSVTSGSFVPTWTGFSIAPATTAFWQRIGGLAIINLGLSPSGTSNATTMSITNLPSLIRPLTSPGSRVACALLDNGADAVGAVGFNSAGVLTFYKGTAPPSSTGFTAAGTKGFNPFGSIIYSVL